ncbi:MFS transporter [Caballeronia sp. 15711]|uniref:MFS transporter n=1 Tax=Caballeronia sp. 15711 TaxID=3391029 RepID=UPI0039E29642
MMGIIKLSRSTRIEQSSNLRRAAFAACVGTIIEWYDYSLYGAAAGLVINVLFFPGMSSANSILAAFATFAVGYFIRPLGGVVIAHLGDAIGRKPALVFSITLMGAATTAMGLLPDYAHIGIAAPLLLVLLRLLQGFGAGAELAGAITLIAEYAPENRRGFYASLPLASISVGITLGTLGFLAVAILPDKTLYGWAWRIPFLVSALLFGVALFIRSSLDETPEYRTAVERAERRELEHKVPLGELLRNSPLNVFLGFLSVSGHNATAYLLSAFAMSYMTHTLGMARGDGLIATVITAFLGIFGTVIGGALADRIGNARVFSLGAGFMLLFSFPLFWMLDTRNFILATTGMGIASLIGVGGMTGGQGAFLVNLFPTRYRFSGIAVARELNGMLIAGPTPLIASALVAYAEGRPTYVALYLMGCCTMTVLSIAAICWRSRHAD